jgi:hypothetical protein
MNEYVLHPRLYENTDWATLLFLVCFAVLAFTRSVFENRFADFINLSLSNKYLKVYRDGSNLRSVFSITMFLVQIVSLTFFIQLSLSTFSLASRTDWMLYIQIFNFLLFFNLSKILIEKIIANCFNIEEFVNQFNLQKLTYRSYIGLLLLPLDIFLFYLNTISSTYILAIGAILLATNVFTYALSIKNYQKLIFSKLFYFILYLCALEIAPYYFVYYCFFKGIAY